MGLNHGKPHRQPRNVLHRIDDCHLRQNKAWIRCECGELILGTLALVNPSLSPFHPNCTLEFAWADHRREMGVTP